ncbi:MAG: flippase [Tannerella sp.]|jgi:PST family polysaccharide transporter|nr:flippase [Tannerella sp.]
MAKNKIWLSLREKLEIPMVSNFFSMVFLQGINYLMPLISYPYLIWTLGIDRWGIVNFAWAFIQYFIIFTDFGFNLSGTKYIAQHRDQPDKINLFLNSAFIGRIGLGVLSFSILAILIFSFRHFREEALFYLLYFGIIVGNVMFPLWFFQGMERMKYIAVFNLIAKSLSFLPMFIFIKAPEHYIYVPVCYSIGYIIAGLFSIYFIYFKIRMKWFIPSFRSIVFALKDSSTYFLSRASVSLFTYTNTFILGLVCGNVVTGYYAIAERLFQAYDGLIQPFTQVLFPHMSRTQDVGFFKKVFKRVVIINVVLFVIVLLLSKWIVMIYSSGAANEQSILGFRILMFAGLFSIPSVMIGYPYLAALGHPKYANWTVIFSSLFHISVIIILFMINQISITHIAILVVCTHLTMFSLRAYGVRKFSRL